MTGRGEANIGSLLDGVLANLDLKRRFREHLLLSAWPEIAGRVVAAHSRPEIVRDGVLIVGTDTAVWAQELQMRTQELLRLVERHVGEGVVREIHFRVGKKRTQKKARPVDPRPAEMKLSSKLEKQIERATDNISDVQLRSQITRALTSLARISAWRKQGGWRQCQRCGRWQRVGRRWCSFCARSRRRRRRR